MNKKIPKSVDSLLSRLDDEANEINTQRLLEFLETIDDK